MCTCLFVVWRRNSNHARQLWLIKIVAIILWEVRLYCEFQLMLLSGRSRTFPKIISIEIDDVASETLKQN